jgi:hypothetical protein
MAYIIILIVAALLIALLISWVGSRKKQPANISALSDQPIDNRPSDCCGAHEVCESDSLLSSSDEIEYFNDEELDRFRGRLPQHYSDIEIEEFREVLYTLLEREVAAWMKSLQLRQIMPPVIVREEALMIVSDRRFAT